MVRDKTTERWKIDERVFNVNVLRFRWICCMVYWSSYVPLDVANATRLHHPV